MVKKRGSPTARRSRKSIRLWEQKSQGRFGVRYLLRSLPISCVLFLLTSMVLSFRAVFLLLLLLGSDVETRTENQRLDRNAGIDGAAPEKVSDETAQLPTGGPRSCRGGFVRPFSAWSRGIEKPRVYQLSGKFGHENKFEEHVKNHTVSSLATGVFDEVFGYYEFPEFILKDVKWERNIKFLTDPKDRSRVGGGYWFWKAILIRHHLERINEGDFLVYVDNDVRKHWWILPYLLEDMVQRNKNLAMIEMPKRLEKLWTKRDVYEAYCHQSPENDPSAQFEAMFMVMRKDNAVMQFAHQYVEAVQDWHALSDEPSWLPNFEFFSGHRRDQSLVNGILKCRYREPERETYTRPCTWRSIQMYSLPVWEDAKIEALLNETAMTFRKQESLHRQASKEKRISANDPYWSQIS